MKQSLLFCMGVLVAATQFSSAAYYEGRSRLTFQDPVRGVSIAVTIVYPADAPGGTDAPLAGTASGTVSPFGVAVIAHGYQLPVAAYASLATAVCQSSANYIAILPETGSGLFPSHAEFAADIVSCLAWIQQENARPGSRWHDAIRDEYVLIGHSMGGGSSFLAAKTILDQTDWNLVSVIALAPAETNPSATAAAALVTCPTLILAGSEDCVTPLTSIQPIYNAVPATCKTLGVIPGGSHCQFADQNTLCSIGEFNCPGTINRSQQLATTFAYVDHMFTKDARAMSAIGGTQIQTTMKMLLSSDIRMSTTVGCVGDTVVLTYTGPVGSLLWLPDRVRSATYRYVIRERENVITLVNETCFERDEVDTIIAWARPPELQMIGPSTICPGDTVMLRAAASSDATIEWSTGATTPEIMVHMPGTYRAIARSTRGCGEVIDSIEVRGIPVPTVRVVIQGDTVLCNRVGGLQLSVSVDGPGYRSTIWSTGDTSDVLVISEPGSYTIAANVLPEKEDGCTLSVDPVRFTMRNYEPPTTTLTLRGDTLWASPLADSYQWFAGSVPITGWNRQWYIPTKSAAYRVVTRSRSSGNCASKSEPFQYEPTTVPEGEPRLVTASWHGDRICVHGAAVDEEVALYTYEGALVKEWALRSPEHCEYVGADVSKSGGVFFLVRGSMPGKGFPDTTPGKPFPGITGGHSQRTATAFSSSCLRELHRENAQRGNASSRSSWLRRNTSGTHAGN